MIKKLKCESVYIYAMGLEPWLNYIMAVDYTETSLPIIESNKVLTMCKNLGLEAEILFEKREWLLTS